VRVRPAGKGCPIQAAEKTGGEEVGKMSEGLFTLKPVGKEAPRKGLPYLVPSP